MICTDLLWIPQVKEVEVALVTHLLVCGEHDDVAAEIKATRSDSRVGFEQGQLFTCAVTHTHTIELTTQEENLGTLATIYLNCATVLTPRTVDLPVSQSQSRQLLSADPVKTFLVSPESGQVKETVDSTGVDSMHRNIQFQINTTGVC